MAENAFGVIPFQIIDATAAAPPRAPAAGDRGDEAWFDRLTMIDYQLPACLEPDKACPELVEGGPTKAALDA